MDVTGCESAVHKCIQKQDSRKSDAVGSMAVLTEMREKEFHAEGKWHFSARKLSKCMLKWFRDKT